MKTLRTLTAAGAIAIAGSAFAADLPSRRAPAPYLAPPPVFTWTGFYIGLNAGAGFRTNTNNGNNFLNGGFGGNSNGNNVAFIGGGQIGYNWQTGPIVFGLETDAQYRSSFGVGNNGGLFGNTNQRNDGFLGTARGRIGYAFSPMFMIYATGGAAYGNTFANANNNNFLFGGFGGFGGNNNNNNFRVGYTVGGGLEYAFTPNWVGQGRIPLRRPRSYEPGKPFRLRWWQQPFAGACRSPRCELQVRWRVLGSGRRPLLIETPSITEETRRKTPGFFFGAPRCSVQSLFGRSGFPFRFAAAFRATA